eukprot:CAMPEP_0202712778 /NCGR_PEP_ID=MMETSP1385-20130828/45392_1 /ASSEMBLY_ACC=CAM_ASM_000861 /TAXON_ID=933848 /ORGANISM="Elphidium margaritaceum" /LENGTH=389 /DNA_ID=CAMNT_0049372921 /DNA_START=32 /DNA_END=1198 /DNA_ORIENTATION=-
MAQAEKALEVGGYVGVVISSICFVTASVFTAYSTKRAYWKEKGAPKPLWIPVLLTVISYLLAICFIFLTFVFWNLYGWDSDGNDRYDDPHTVNHVLPRYCFFLFCLFYLFALVLNIWVWIKRLQSSFENSVYGYSPCFMSTFNVSFAFVVLVGFITLLCLPFLSGTITMVLLTVLFVLSFVAELLALITAFVYKLVQLRTLAEKQCHADVSNINSATMQTIQRLFRLQIKITILALTQMLSTVVTLPLGSQDELAGRFAMVFDVTIGFFCVYCSIQPHNAIYQVLCCVPIKCCERCARLEELDDRCRQQIQLHNESKLVVDTKSPDDNTPGTIKNNCCNSESPWPKTTRTDAMSRPTLTARTSQTGTGTAAPSFTITVFTESTAGLAAN